MRILMTWSASYIGPMLAARLLAAGHRVSVLEAVFHDGRVLRGALPGWPKAGREC
jgi:UDP-glucose 4-epimerase